MIDGSEGGPARGSPQRDRPRRLRARIGTHRDRSAGYAVALSTLAGSLRSGAGWWFLVTARVCASQDLHSPPELPPEAAQKAGGRGFAGSGFGRASIRLWGSSVRRVEPRRRLANLRLAGSASAVGLFPGRLVLRPVQDVRPNSSSQPDAACDRDAGADGLPAATRVC
jgi:hypothetical protein